MKKRKDGRYLRVRDYNDGKGKQFFYGRTEDEVIGQQKEYEKKLNQIELTKLTFKYWAERWEESHNKEIKYNTAECYKKPLEDIIEEFGVLNIDKIKASEVKSFITKLTKKGFAKQTIKLRLIVMNQVFNYAIENDVLVFNFINSIKLPKNLPVSTRSPLSSDDERKVRESKDVYANFLLNTGVRRNEALAVKWENIDFENKRILIDGSILWINNKAYLETTKTNSGVRYAPLLAELEQLLLPIKKSSGFIFNADGLPLTRSQSTKMWRRYRETYDIKGTIHQFRHSFITLMYNSGIDVKSAQGIAGHSKVDTMLDIYTHLDLSNQQNAAIKINDYLKNNSRQSQK